MQTLHRRAHSAQINHSAGSFLSRPRCSRSRSRPACRASVQTAGSLDQLLAWASSNSIDASKLATSVNIATDQPMWVASKDLSAGDTVVAVPEAAWLTPDAVQRAARVGGAVAGLEPWLQLALYLLAEKASPSGGPLQGYLASLPAQLESPLFWSEEELALLQGTQVMENMQAYK